MYKYDCMCMKLYGYNQCETLEMTAHISGTSPPPPRPRRRRRCFHSFHHVQVIPCYWV
jgi:hypothetical protein